VGSSVDCPWGGGVEPSRETMLLGPRRLFRDLLRIKRAARRLAQTPLNHADLATQPAGIRKWTKSSTSLTVIRISGCVSVALRDLQRLGCGCVVPAKLTRQNLKPDLTYSSSKRSTFCPNCSRPTSLQPSPESVGNFDPLKHATSEQKLNDTQGTVCYDFVTISMRRGRRLMSRPMASSYYLLIR
jgi:hypothetical protein